MDILDPMTFSEIVRDKKLKSIAQRIISKIVSKFKFSHFDPFGNRKHVKQISPSLERFRFEELYLEMMHKYKVEKYNTENKLSNYMKWEGIQFEDMHLAWEGPFQNLTEREPQLIAPYEKQIRLNAALKLNGNYPFYTHDSMGELVVYETDKQTWYRRLLGGGESEKQILAIKKSANLTSSLNQSSSNENPIVTIDRCIFQGVISNGIAKVSFLVRNIGSCPAFSVSIKNTFGDVFRAKRQNMASRDESWVRDTIQSYGQFINVVFQVKISYFNQERLGFEDDYQITANSSHQITDIKKI